MRSLTVRLLPVGRGDCILVQFPDQSWAVVDCGQKERQYEPHNQVATVLSNEVPSNSPIRFILATHPDADHDGGIRQLMMLLGDRRPIHAVYYSGVERRGAPCASDRVKDDGCFSYVEEASKRVAGGEIRECRALEADDQIDFDPPMPDVAVDVLHPYEGIVRRANSVPNLDAYPTLRNNVSVVLRIRFGGRTVLLPGDIQGKVCEEVLGLPEASDPHVLKAPHHGGRSSAPPSAVFVSPAGKRYLLVSSPTDSDKHPHEDTLAAVPVATDGWQIRCTGLARFCIHRQPPETWPWDYGQKSYLPESLRRSFFSIAGKSRVPLNAYAECCLNNMVTVTEDGAVEHAEAERACDGGDTF